MRISLGGIPIDNVTKEGALERALAEGGVNVVFTPNAVMLDACRRDRTITELWKHASLSLPDGVGVLWAAKRMGTPIRERVAGIDFGEALLARAAREGLRVFLLGGGDGVALQAARNLRARYKGLCICGTHWGYFDKTGEENRRVLTRIRESRADVLFVCFGFPMQERWITDNLHALSHLRVVAALGGSLDVWSGKTKRAPEAVSRMGLEWAWRMAREPHRLKGIPALVRCAFCRKGRAF